MIQINLVDLLFAIIIALVILIFLRIVAEFIDSDYKYLKEKERSNAAKYWNNHFTEMNEEEKRNFIRKYF